MISDKEVKEKQEEMKLCGRTRGEHNFYPIVKYVDAAKHKEFVEVMLCTKCFFKLKIKDIDKYFK